MTGPWMDILTLASGVGTIGGITALVLKLGEKFFGWRIWAIRSVLRRESRLQREAQWNYSTLKDLVERQRSVFEQEISALQARLDTLQSHLREQEELRRMADVRAEVAAIGKADAEKALAAIKTDYDHAVEELALLRRVAQEKDSLADIRLRKITELEARLRDYEHRIKALEAFIESHQLPIPPKEGIPQ